MVSGATSGSGVHSSTSSSTSYSIVRGCYSKILFGFAVKAHLFGKSDIALLLGRVRGRKEVSESKKAEEQLDPGPDRVVLVAGSDVSEEDGRARDFLEDFGQGIG